MTQPEALRWGWDLEWQINWGTYGAILRRQSSWPRMGAQYWRFVGCVMTMSEPVIWLMSCVQFVEKFRIFLAYQLSQQMFFYLVKCSRCPMVQFSRFFFIASNRMSVTAFHEIMLFICSMGTTYTVMDYCVMSGWVVTVTCDKVLVR